MTEIEAAVRLGLMWRSEKDKRVGLWGQFITYISHM